MSKARSLFPENLSPESKHVVLISNVYRCLESPHTCRKTSLFPYNSLHAYYDNPECMKGKFLPFYMFCTDRDVKFFP